MEWYREIKDLPADKRLEMWVTRNDIAADLNFMILAAEANHKKSCQLVESALLRIDNPEAPYVLMRVWGWCRQRTWKAQGFFKKFRENLDMNKLGSGPNNFGSVLQICDLLTQGEVSTR